VSDTIYLDPDLFMALGLSADANGGIARGVWFLGNAPGCPIGHSHWLDGVVCEAGMQRHRGPVRQAMGHGWTWLYRNDRRLRRRGVQIGERVPFEKWCRIVGVDVAA